MERWRGRCSRCSSAHSSAPEAVLAEVDHPPARSGSVDVDPELQEGRNPAQPPGGVRLPRGGQRGRRPSKTVLGAEELGERGGTEPVAGRFSVPVHRPGPVLHVSEGDGAQVVLLDAGVAPLGRWVGRLPSRSWDVHADHVPEVALQRPPVAQ